MAGHSKFKNIMHRKGAQDKKRSAMFSKLSREITVAAKLGLPDPDMNARLRAAVLAARPSRCPRTISSGRSTRRGGDAENYEEIRYEGFGPGGVASSSRRSPIIATAPRPMSAPPFPRMAATSVRQRHVSHGFERLGLIEYPASAGDADKVLEAAIEAGADDVESDDEGHGSGPRR